MPHRQKGTRSPFNCTSIPQSRVCGKEKPFRICKFLLRCCVVFHVFLNFFNFFLKKKAFFLFGFGIVYKSQGHARLAQLVEHLLDVQEVTGSSPVPRTKIDAQIRKNLGVSFLVDFLYNIGVGKCCTVGRGHPTPPRPLKRTAPKNAGSALKVFVGDDACIVPTTGIKMIAHLLIIPRQGAPQPYIP